MAQQLGRSLLLKKDISGTKTTICGFTTRTFRIGNNLIDATVPDCTTPGGIVHEAFVYGNQSMEFSGNGIFDDDAAANEVISDVQSQASDTYDVVVPGLGTFTMTLLIENFEFTGETEGNMGFSATFRRSGSSTFA